MKFKVGDKVKTKDGKGVIKNIACDGDYGVDLGDNYVSYIWYKESQLKLIKPKLTEKRIREIIQEELKVIPVTTTLDKLKNRENQELPPIKWNYGSLSPESIVKTKEDKPKSGWYKNDDYSKWLVYRDFENNVRYGFDVHGGWFYDDYMIRTKPLDGDYLADLKEVEQRLKEEAKRRGFVKGVKINSEWLCGDISSRQITGNLSFDGFELVDQYKKSHTPTYTYTIFKEGKWAEVIKEKVIIEGYEMKQESNQIKFGCMSFTSSSVKSLYRQCKSLGVYSLFIRDTDGVSHNITIEQLKKIVDNIK